MKDKIKEPLIALTVILCGLFLLVFFGLYLQNSDTPVVSNTAPSTSVIHGEDYDLVCEKSKDKPDGICSFTYHRNPLNDLTITWLGTVSYCASKGLRFELGLRSDNIVVWRKVP